jgi:hypothetical protein
LLIGSLGDDILRGGAGEDAEGGGGDEQVVQVVPADEAGTAGFSIIADPVAGSVKAADIDATAFGRGPLD